ncbi:LIN1-like protein [Golovinomyces cichoracearum]|uniref:LIN1-like protein n=1 Tax=Golovinomyces cichoracearum TaxID=62708 RepID=A0A420ICV6_9PEZI|nr:LIN1-like protein [Golovinomyces cichoracearum]
MSNRYFAARPKRAGEEYARTHHGNKDSSSSSANNKKPRFDLRNPSALAPDVAEEDAVLQADVIGLGGMSTKRGAVNIDGYDSDSENDGFDARAEERAKMKGKRSGDAVRLEEAFEDLDSMKNDMDEDVEEDDMFADPENEHEDSSTDKGHSKKNQVRFMEEDEILGQVESSKSRGHISKNFALDPNGELSTHAMDDQVSSDDEEDAVLNAIEEDVDEEVGAGGLKRNAPKVDAFNMKNEQEEGRFDEAGNYVRKAADPDAKHDEWLEGVSKKEMKRAAEAHEKREAELRRKRTEEDSIFLPDILRVLIEHLDKGETILEALARLGKSQTRAKKIPKWKLKNKKQSGNEKSMNADTPNPAEDPEQIRIKNSIIAITGAADQLIMRGQMDIYDQEREILMRQYKREVGTDWVEKADLSSNKLTREFPLESKTATNVPHVSPVKMWEYRWTDGRDESTKQGPFDGASMKAWNEAGYFRENVEFRREGDTGPWSRVVQFI